jgi:hypothetical protein
VELIMMVTFSMTLSSMLKNALVINKNNNFEKANFWTRQRFVACLIYILRSYSQICINKNEL